MKIVDEVNLLITKETKSIDEMVSTILAISKGVQVKKMDRDVEIAIQHMFAEKFAKAVLKGVQLKIYPHDEPSNL